MKRLVMLVLVMLVGFSTNALCGAPPALDEGVVLLADGYHKLILPKNADGTLGGIESGSIKIRTVDVAEVYYDSYRMGHGDFSSIRAELVGRAAVLNGMPNNDKYGKYVVKMNNGKSYRIKTEDFTVRTQSPMFYAFSHEGVTYGELAKSRMILSFNGTTANLRVEFGCDLPIGVTGDHPMTAPTEGRFMLENGCSYIAPVSADKSGNLWFELSGIELDELDKYGNRSKMGILVVMINGQEYWLNLDWTQDDQTFVWEPEFSGTGIYAYYVQENGRTVITTW